MIPQQKVVKLEELSFRVLFGGVEVMRIFRRIRVFGGVEFSALPKVFPDRDPPSDPKAKVWRFVGGKRREVYLVLKKGHKEHLYDLEDFDEAAVEKDTLVAEATAEDDDEERENVGNLAAVMFAHGHQERSEGKGVDMEEEDAAARAAEDVEVPQADGDSGGEDTDDDCAMPLSALQAVFSNRPQVAPKTSAKPAAKAATPCRAPATPAARRPASAPPTPAALSAPGTPARLRATPAPGTPAPARPRKEAPDAAERAPDKEEGGGSGKKGIGRPRTALTTATKKALEEARELQDAFLEGSKHLAIQAEGDSHDKAAQKEWKRQALHESKAIEVCVAKGKKFQAKAQKIAEGLDQDLDLARVTLGKRCDAMESALRVVRAERAFNTRIPFRLQFNSIRFRFDSKRTRTPIRFQVDV